ncbi:hypothetical protein HZA98_00480 [Candidatus Woesearchaeota archaeon]|nr:hypothetical protein [Candidatus Woesearchaeota archaeon]
MDEQHVLRCVKHLPPKERRQALKAWENLLSNGLILKKPSKKDLQVSLNPKRRTEIEQKFI